jgi:hypothetical protein
MTTPRKANFRRSAAVELKVLILACLIAGGTCKKRQKVQIWRHVFSFSGKVNQQALDLREGLAI